MESASRYRDGAGQIIQIKFVQDVSEVIVADAADPSTLPIMPLPQRLPQYSVVRLPTVSR